MEKPGKSWKKIANLESHGKVMEFENLAKSHGKVMENEILTWKKFPGFQKG